MNSVTVCTNLYQIEQGMKDSIFIGDTVQKPKYINVPARKIDSIEDDTVQVPLDESYPFLKATLISLLAMNALGDRKLREIETTVEVGPVDDT